LFVANEAIQFLRAGVPGYHPGWGRGEYSSWQDEQLSWKKNCYVGDWSFLWDVVFEGPDALKLFSDTGINSLENFAVGQAKHLVQCSSRGKVIADGVLMRTGENSFRTQSTTAMWSAFWAEKHGYDLSWRLEDTFQFQVSGPTALATSNAATGTDLSTIRFMRFGEVEIAGRPVRALRQGMAGEIGFEFHGAMADAGAVLKAILAAGAPHGIRRLGSRTAMINHLEAAFPTGLWHYLVDMFAPETEGYADFIAKNFDTWGVGPAMRGSFESDDLVDYLLSPYELGWGKSVKFDHAFLGREALEAEAAGPRRSRVTLELHDEDVVEVYRSLFQEGEPLAFMEIPHPVRWTYWADAVFLGNKRVGIAAAPGYSLHFRHMLALAFVESEAAVPGTEVELLWGEPGSRQKRLRAVVAPAPYKTDRRREGITL